MAWVGFIDDTSTQAFSYNNYYQRGTGSKPRFLCHKRNLISLSFIQIHVDLPQFPVLSLPSIGVQRPQDYNDTSNRECKHFVIGPTISTFLTATIVETDSCYLCGIPWKLSINKEISHGKGALWGSRGGVGWNSKPLWEQCLICYLKHSGPNRSATLTNMQRVVSHQRNYQRS